MSFTSFEKLEILEYLNSCNLMNSLVYEQLEQISIGTHLSIYNGTNYDLVPNHPIKHCVESFMIKQDEEDALIARVTWSWIIFFIDNSKSKLLSSHQNLIHLKKTKGKWIRITKRNSKLTTKEKA